MDYSILLKICKPSSCESPFLFHNGSYTFCIGIIDFLQKFTWAKNAELKIKSVFNDEDQISSVGGQQGAAAPFNNLASSPYTEVTTL